MKAEQNTFRYSFEFPEGKLFLEGDEIPEEFVDSPKKLGINKLDSAAKIAEKCKKGLGGKDDSEGDLEGKIELETLRGDYMEKFGKKPHHLMKIETLKEALK